MRDKQQRDLGVIIAADFGEETYKVAFSNGVDWLTDAFLEVISESR